MLLGSAATGVGIDRLADFLCELSPSAADRSTAVAAGDSSGRRGGRPDGPAARATCSRRSSIRSSVSSRCSRCCPARCATDDRLINSSTGAEERLHGLFMLRGKEQTPVTEVVAGDIAAVAKLANTHTGDTLAPKGSPVQVEAAGASLAPVRRGDRAAHPGRRRQARQRARSGSRPRIPSLYVDRVEETQQTVLRGLGDTHIPSRSSAWRASSA